MDNVYSPWRKDLVKVSTLSLYPLDFLVYSTTFQLPRSVHLRDILSMRTASLKCQGIDISPSNPIQMTVGSRINIIASLSLGRGKSESFVLHHFPEFPCRIKIYSPLVASSLMMHTFLACIHIAPHLFQFLNHLQ